MDKVKKSKWSLKDTLVVSLGFLAVIALGLGLFFESDIISYIRTNTEQVSLISGILFTIIMISMFGYLGYAIFSVIKNERNAKKYRKEIGVGDDVHFSSRISRGNVIKTDGDHVFVEVKVHKNSIYPDEKI